MTVTVISAPDPRRLDPVERVAGVAQAGRDFEEVLRRVGLGNVDGDAFDRRGDLDRRTIAAAVLVALALAAVIAGAARAAIGRAAFSRES